MPQPIKRKLNAMTRATMVRLVKEIYFRTPLWRFFLPIMKFDMTIAQLNFITSTLRTIKNDGAVVEIGVGGGATSVVINNFMKENKIERPFVAIDTFFGFTQEDADYERKFRGKTEDYLAFRSNRKDWYSKTLRAHGVEGARVFQADAKEFDFAAIGPIAFALLDVDLYKPVQTVLPQLYQSLAPDGLIIVDDCATEASLYDGAGEAYREFCSRMGIAQELVHDKLGIIKKTILKNRMTAFRNRSDSNEFRFEHKPDQCGGPLFGPDRGLVRRLLMRRKTDIKSTGRPFRLRPHHGYQPDLRK